MIKTIKKYLSGCLNAFILSAIFGLSIHSVYADEITNTNNYLPNGKYRLFGSGRGEVQNIHNNIHLHGQLTQQAGNLQIETRLYQGNLSYEQHFNNHGHQVHSPFSNTAQRNFSAKKGSIVQGGATLTDLSVTGYEIHPADAYDGEQGGGYPVPTGARDEYLYEVNGKEVGVKVLALDKLPNKADDNQLLRQAGIDPAPYNKPQNSDDRTQIQRLSGVGKNTYGGVYSHLNDLSRNGNGWASAEVPLYPLYNQSVYTNQRMNGVVTTLSPMPFTVGSNPSIRTTYRYGNPLSTPGISKQSDMRNVVALSTASKSTVGGLSLGGSSNGRGSLGGNGNGGSNGNGSGNDNGNQQNDNLDDGNDDGYDDDNNQTNNQQDCWIFGDSGCQPSIQDACVASSEADSFAMGGCTKHDESYRLIYLGEPVFIGANYGDDNQEDDNQDDREQDDEEKPQSFEDFIFELSQLPPLTGEPSDDNTQSENKSQENQSDKNNNNSDEQAEKWGNDSPFNVNMAELAAELGNLVNDGVLSLATRNLLFVKSDDAAIRAAIASGDTDIISTALNISEAEAEAIKLAAKRVSKAAGNAST
ncbi:MAG: MafB family polymorphic toxin, partial [Bacteroidales bacterium]|nr:MafB family polymorphic toxin [Bacteroidales bacterium]